MAKKITYEGIQKSFKLYVKKVKMYKETRMIVRTFLVAFILLLGILIINIGIFGFGSEEIIYNQNSNLNYFVCLEEDNCIEGNDTSSFISDLVDDIKVNFNYGTSFSDKVESTYSYSILGEIVISRINDENAIIPDHNLDRKYDLSGEEPRIVVNTSELNKVSGFKEADVLEINDEFIFDYVFFENYIKNFRQNYESSIQSKLVVTISINNTVGSSMLHSQILTNNRLVLEIPLNEQFIQVSTSGTLVDEENIATNIIDDTIVHPIIMVIGIIITGLSVIYIFVNLYKLYATTFKKDIYNYTIKKYLREYDRVIISTRQPSINEANYKNKIRVMSIEELLDAHDNTNNPIIYYEVVPNEKSYFILLDNVTLYKLTISRKYLEEEIKDNLKKKMNKKKTNN